MTDLSEDIREAARDVAETVWLGSGDQRDLIEAISQAILSERSRQIERDAKIAEGNPAWDDVPAGEPSTRRETRADIAAAIRAQEPK